MPLPTKPAKAAKAAPASAVAAPHQHQIPGVESSPAPKPTIGGLKGALLGLASKPSPKKGAKKDHVIDLPPEFTAQLQELQTVNATIKSYETRKSELQSELYPAIEERRKALCKSMMEYIGSVKVRSGDDSGVGTYFIKNQWVGMNAADSEQMSQAVEALKTALSLDDESVSEWMAANMKTRTEVSFKEESLDDPAVIALIQEHLGQHVEVKMTLVPSKHLADSASYDAQSAAALDALESARLVKRYAATLKPAGKTD
jgi:hypothetical protein